MHHGRMFTIVRHGVDSRVDAIRRACTWVWENRLVTPRKRARVCYFKTARYFAISLSSYAIGRAVLHVCDETAALRDPRE